MKVVIEVQKYEDDKNENKVKRIEKMEVKWYIFWLGFLWKENEKCFIDRRENEEDERVRDLSKFVQTLKNGLYEWLGWSKRYIIGVEGV